MLVATTEQCPRPVLLLLRLLQHYVARIVDDRRLHRIYLANPLIAGSSLVLFRFQNGQFELYFVAIAFIAVLAIGFVINFVLARIGAVRHFRKDGGYAVPGVGCHTITNPPNKVGIWVALANRIKPRP